MAALVWFRNDLRVLDNDAVQRACAEHDRVVFLVTPTLKQYAEHDWSAIKWDLYNRQLNSLGADVAALGYELRVHELDYFSECANFLATFCQTEGINSLYFNREYPVDEIRRDNAVVTAANAVNVDVHCFDSNVLVAPEQIKNGKGEYYKVFTPFFKAWLKHLREYGVPAAYSRQRISASAANKSSIVYEPKWFDLPAYQHALLADEHQPEVLRSSAEWAVGEAVIRKQAQQFVKEYSKDYQEKRDFPALTGTSKLSPYFEIGAISPRVAAHLLQQLSPEFPDNLPQGSHTWLSELAWREFYLHLLFHEPRLSMGEPFQAEQKDYPWRNNERAFAKWCNGNTGFPIVDAGMRELNTTGWMHNRVRMIVASFLVKDLHINWQWGERYFMQRLIDGSFAANNGGWQWSAGTGTDAAPYFRVFNPTTQGEKFDPSGRYIRKWVQELADVPDKHLHEPHKWLQQNNLFAEAKGKYGKPIVNHKQAREDFIAAFKAVKNAVQERT